MAEGDSDLQEQVPSEEQSKCMENDLLKIMIKTQFSIVLSAVYTSHWSVKGDRGF